MGAHGLYICGFDESFDFNRSKQSKQASLEMRMIHSDLRALAFHDGLSCNWLDLDNEGPVH